VATDNRNRTAADIRSIFSKNHGNLASSGSVSYMFHCKGLINVDRDSIDEDRLLEIVLDAGAEELTVEDRYHVITTAPDQLYSVVEALKQANIEPESHKLAYVPDTSVRITDEATASQVIRLYDALDDCEDVQNVYANFDIPEELFAKLTA
jgi:YebC/PmpR family DNA-binding regulatory protein